MGCTTHLCTGHVGILKLSAARYFPSNPNLAESNSPRTPSDFADISEAFPAIQAPASGIAELLHNKQINPIAPEHYKTDKLVSEEVPTTKYS